MILALVQLFQTEVEQAIVIASSHHYGCVGECDRYANLEEFNIFL
ncbi:hypothetical protein [Anabaena sp. CCY 9402-a]